MKVKRIEILGIPVDCVNMQQTLDVVMEMIDGDYAKTIIAVNPEKVIKAQSDPILETFLRNSSILIPDGIGLVFAARLLGLAKIERVPGSELMPAICELASRKNYRIFLFGASPDVNNKTRIKLEAKHPGIQIVGSRDGYVTEHDMPVLVNEINDSGAQILFIALGSPKQELWMEKYLPQLNIKVCQGVGGTFDVIAGQVKRAPYLFRKVHMEWLYRLLTNPRRLIRQTALPKFVFQVMKKRILG